MVDESLPRQRLDVFLRRKLPDLSRGAIQRLLAQGDIRVDGKVVKPTHHPRVGETVVLQRPEARPAIAQAEDMPLDILFEDEDLLVLNKPAGWVVHPAAGHKEHTLVNALLHHCRGQLSGIGGVARPGIVHRLDKDTSGCLVAAKNDAAHVHLSAQFAGRDIKKIYQALACGRMPRLSGQIDAPIARDPSHRQRMAVRGRHGRQARTSYRVLERWAAATLVELDLHTGRTHQIRVHLRHLGFPVAGDLVYGRRATARLEETAGYKAPRPLLHARKLTLTHPRHGRRMTFEAALPEDFALALDYFRRQGQCG
ncbi:MAG TPA: RluA family pseudouridine synthase [Candidatus Cybelea sp.]|nr:RluA family pseudouridine synthase [Candidatus Cybelea sp.]